MSGYERSEITAGEAARILGITRQSVHGRIQSGALVPVGRSIDGVYVFSRRYIEGVRDNALRSEGIEAEEGETAARSGVLPETAVP